MNVTALKHKDGESAPVVQEAIAVGSSFAFELGNGSKLVMQTHFERDAPIEVWNATFDKMREAGRRQELHVRLDSAKANLDHQRRELRTALERLDVAEAAYTEAVAERAQRLAKVRQDQMEFVAQDKIAFGASGKRGDYVQSNAARSRTVAFERQANAIEEEAKAADLDRENAIKASKAAQISYQKEIDFYEGEIAKLSALLGVE